jgi:hypothetical protein
MSKRIIFLFVMLVLFSISCEEQDEMKKQDPAPSSTDASTLDMLGRAPGKTDGLVGQMATCGGSYNGTYTTISSYYTYPARSIDVSCAATGATVTVFFDAVEIPNKFIVKDANGNYMGNSGWRGYASYGGPWGSSLSQPTSGSFSFTKQAGVSTYYLHVETLTPPNYNYNPNTDAWSASASCTCAPPPCPTCPTGYICVNGVCKCNIPCGGGFSGNYNTIASYYTYPARTIDVTCAAAGATITVFFDAVEIPNRFTVKTAGGTTVGYSGWRGYASYGGPWGSSLAVSTTGSFTFTKSAGVNTYYLYVETLTPPNNSYNPNTDAWSASVSCPL